VHPAEAAGREDADPRPGRDACGGRDGRPRGSTLGSDDGHVAQTRLEHIGAGRQGGQHRVGQHRVGQHRVGQPDADPAGDHGHGRGDGTVVPYRPLGGARHPQVVRPRQAVRDQGALERDHRPSGGECVADLGMYVQAGHGVSLDSREPG